MRQPWLPVATVAIVAAAVVVLAGGGDAFWLCLPAVLLLCTLARTRTASFASAAAVRERLEREQAARRSGADSDPPTGIANRRLLSSRTQYEIARHTRARQKFALLMLDLDSFKPLNDRFGRAAGDELLREVARGLTHAMRAQDTVARIGGDDFCVLAPETHEAQAASLAKRIAATVVEASADVRRQAA